MGKRNKRTNAGRAGRDNTAKRDILESVNQLLQKASYPFNSNPLQNWEEFKSIHEHVEKIRKLQRGTVHQVPRRGEHFHTYLGWVQGHGVDTSAVSIHKFDKEGYGLQAEKELQAGELYLEIPRKIMMTTANAKESCLAHLIKEDRILQTMPNVVLALYLLCEATNKDSFYAPYINCLPDSYETPLYMSIDNIEQLKGSPLQADVMNQYKNIARQYAYFYSLFHSSPDARGLPIKDFCYDDYRWAVSTVMTRQNQIPGSAESRHMITALIPLWDLCNHANGELSTDFSIEKNAGRCLAMRSFSKGDQIYIFYGARSNHEFLLHNGFYYPPNENDKLALKLGVSKSDPLYAMKVESLARLSLLSPRVFHLYSGTEPVDSELLAFLRIFHMSEDELKSYLMGERSNRLSLLREFGTPVSLENEKKCWSYLQTRATLLLSAYPNLIQDDIKLLLPQEKPLPHQRWLMIMQRMGEKQILESSIKFCITQVKNAEDYYNSLQNRVDESSHVDTNGMGHTEDEVKPPLIAPHEQADAMKHVTKTDISAKDADAMKGAKLLPKTTRKPAVTVAKYEELEDDSLIDDLAGVEVV